MQIHEQIVAAYFALFIELKEMHFCYSHYLTLHAGILWIYNDFSGNNISCHDLGKNVSGTKQVKYSIMDLFSLERHEPTCSGEKVLHLGQISILI